MCLGLNITDIILIDQYLPVPYDWLLIGWVINVPNEQVTIGWLSPNNRTIMQIRAIVYTVNSVDKQRLMMDYWSLYAADDVCSSAS